MKVDVERLEEVCRKGDLSFSGKEQVEWEILLSVVVECEFNFF